MTGYNLMTEEQRQDWDRLEEKYAHSGTMRFTDLDFSHLMEYRELCTRLVKEYLKC